MKFAHFLKTVLIDSIETNKKLLLVSVFLTAISILLFVLDGIGYGTNPLLASSTSTPWGVVTAIFIHANSTHIGFNLLFLWIWTIFLVIEHDLLKHSFLTKAQIGKRLGFMVVFVFGSAIASNIIWSILLKPGSTTMGSSGVVYALSGACLVFSLMNIPIVFRAIKRSDLQDMRKMATAMGILAINALIFWMIFTMVTADTKAFFGFGDPQTNAFAHWTSFLITFFLVTAYDYYLFHWPTLSAAVRAAKYRRAAKRASVQAWLSRC